MSGDCRDCKDYRECISPPGWFHYGQIRWCPYQVIWIITYSDTLRAGRWPKDPDNQDDNAGQRKINTEGTFVKPIIILSEVESRLARTGIQGKLLLAQVEAGRTFEILDRDAKDALLYVKGFKRKRMSFSAWKKKRRYYWKRHQRVTMPEQRKKICTGSA